MPEGYKNRYHHVKISIRLQFIMYIYREFVIEVFGYCENNTGKPYTIGVK